MKIFLIGLPGSGKSTLGKELAASLDILFVDLDDEIEKNERKDIKTIFRESGETYFRKIESDSLHKWCESAKDFVMATGGGTPCFLNNMNVIKKAGKSIFLDVPVAEIVRRIHKTERSDRPLLGRIQTEDLHDQIETMHRIRLAFYNQANLKISGSTVTAVEVKERIIVA